MNRELQFILTNAKFWNLEGFALGIAVKILFALLRSKKIGTKSPPERPKQIFIIELLLILKKAAYYFPESLFRFSITKMPAPVSSASYPNSETKISVPLAKRGIQYLFNAF